MFGLCPFGLDPSFTGNDACNKNNNTTLDYHCQKCFLALSPYNTIDNNQLFKQLNCCFTTFAESTYSLRQHDSEYFTAYDINKLASKFHNGFSLLNLNIRSLNKNFDKIESLLHQSKFNPDIICVTETWINNKRPFLHTLAGYTFINKPCPGKVGGVGVFLKHGINFNKIDNLNFGLDNCEDLWTELFISENLKIVLGAVYRHPNYDYKIFKSKLTANIENLNNANKSFIIAGDFNINLYENSKLVCEYTNDILSQGTLQLVQQPTRISYSNKTSLIDHVYTNLPEGKTDTSCIAFDISDHLPSITFVNLTKGIKLERGNYIRDTRKFVAETFLNDLESKISNIPYNEFSSNELWDYFENIFNTVLNNHAPLRLKSRREVKQGKKPWITKGILTSIKYKQKLFKEFTKDKSNNKWSNFKKYRNKLTRIIEQSKQNHFKSEICNNRSNIKKLWKTVNEITNIKTCKNTSNIGISSETGKLTSKPVEVSNILNKYFATIGSKLANTISTPINNKLNYLTQVKATTKSIFLKPMTASDVLEYISNLNPNKSTKSNCSPIKYIKLSSHLISLPLSKIFNRCITEGIFPSSLKTAEIIPVYKSKDKTKPSNYRPISLLNPFSKIFERHLHDNINNFLKEHNILYKYQYGFREGSSTELALSQITEELSDNIQNDDITCSIFIDLQKAFDTVDHHILLAKLNKYGLRGLPAQLIENYLSGRKQVTVVNGLHSNLENVKCGVPQGSILGPLFFSLYINDLPNISSFKVRLFADDACLIYKNKNIFQLEQNVNSELIKVNDWLKVNKLSVNYSKTKYIMFTNKKINKDITLMIDNYKLDRVSEIKYLGVVLDESLKWKSHIDLIKTKISRGSYILAKLRHYVPISVLKMVYYAIIHPHLTYCITTWGGACSSTLQSLFNLQKKIVRIITYSDYTAHSAPIFHSLKIFPLEFLYKFKLGLTFYKINSNMIKIGAHSLTHINKVHNYKTRLATNNNFFQKHSTIRIGQSTYSFRGLQFWRELPSNLKNLCFNLFKHKLGQHLLMLLEDTIK